MALQLHFLPLTLSPYNPITGVPFCLSSSYYEVFALVDFSTRNLSPIFPQVSTHISNLKFLSLATLSKGIPLSRLTLFFFFLVLFPLADANILFFIYFLLIACLLPIEGERHENRTLPDSVTATFLMPSTVSGT